MRKCFYILISLSLLAAVVGCGRGVDRRLVLADTLMWIAPDSSLAILSTINRDSLQGDENQAYYALLLTQAQFRCNGKCTTETLINSALEYYKDNHNREFWFIIGPLGLISPVFDNLWTIYGNLCKTHPRAANCP